VPDEPGLTNVEISHEAGHSVKGLYVMGENPIMSEPDGNEVEERLKSLEFMVAQDIFMTETAEFADVVLPRRRGRNAAAQSPTPTAESNACAAPPRWSTRTRNTTSTS